MISGTRDEFVANLEKQFPNEKEAISKCIDLIEVSYMEDQYTKFRY